MHGEQLHKFIVNEHMNLVDAMQRIDQNLGEILFVINDEGMLSGSISDGDVRRWLLKTGKIETEVVSLMNREPKFLYAGGEKDAFKFMQKRQITAVPIVDKQGCICDIISMKAYQTQNVKSKEQILGVNVIIMAGGKGTRLYPYTKILPKPLIPIGDIPIMERVIDEFYTYGVKDFYISVNYKKHMIQSYFSELESDYHIQYIEESKPLGTCGSIRLIDKSFNFPVFVTNCDILIRADYADIYNHHVKSGNAVTLVTALKNDTIPYGVVHSKENGEIINIEEKPQRSYMVNTGMYVINPEIIKLIPENTYFHMTDLTEKAIQQGYTVGMYPVSEDSFLDMGEFAEMKRMEERLSISKDE